ncbi:biotin-dependent carboxyltransferase family protein [Lysinibacillus odysseyi]|uniref:KipI antagonist n=1 Tax=Lysinibacillus odysseyi 34hs-1 = NBRC 100172 TaxID=1220589 RepID=A0A0A3IN59_9BACI|nr:biotin-dependent carboxyltransferase family protein [Lysinibacillus odysseyi]KGR84890.1 KipI antagonist [Lysinibacillus odysseyi 34hs-1 = NBRC 100172]
MSVQVLHGGLLTTVQDLGRFGFQKYGVIVSGAMDCVSMRVANLLVGNEEEEGVLEVTMFGTKLHFEQDQLVAITGGDLQPTIDGQPAPMWRPVLIRRGSILQFKSAIRGCRSYLAFAGGIDIPLVMGSKSTYLRAGIGGLSGRALQKGDCFACSGTTNPIGQSFIQQLEQADQSFTWYVDVRQLGLFRKNEAIRVMHGSEFHRFNPESRHAFFSSLYKITTQSDRMGYRLEGPPLHLSETFDLLSEGVTYGTIQVPSNGQPIILMADRQTTGGYPKIGQIISADLPRLAQMQPNTEIRFTEVSLEQAEEALFEIERVMADIALGIRLKAQS